MSFDIWLFNAVNHLPHWGWADSFALFMAFMGQRDVVSGIAITFAVVGLFSARKSIWMNALGVLAGSWATWFIVYTAKAWIGRPRPYEVLSDVYLVGEASGASFPSGHAAMCAFVASFMLIRVVKRGRFFWYLAAFLGGTLRIYQGFHYPSDIVAGWILGALIGWLAAFLFSSFNVLRYNGTES